MILGDEKSSWCLGALSHASPRGGGGRAVGLVLPVQMMKLRLGEMFADEGSLLGRLCRRDVQCGARGSCGAGAGPEGLAVAGADYLAAASQGGPGHQGQGWVRGGHSCLWAGITYQLVQVIYSWCQYTAFRIPGLPATETTSG